jgi:hypothetical protein
MMNLTFYDNLAYIFIIIILIIAILIKYFCDYKYRCRVEAIKLN